MHLISPPHDWFGIFAMSSLHGDDIFSISSESNFSGFLWQTTKINLIHSIEKKVDD
jgi:hypothetical protein